ncbi:MAG: hypothetical protein MAG451_00664 [Anaerolineales bacterium]|nr:hypothetical protein [Anaerolineales bacterium]
MPISIPRSVREAWGEEATDNFNVWFNQAIQAAAVPRDEYRQVLSRLDILEHDVAAVKQKLGDLRREMNERFERMDGRFDQINERFDRMNERFDQMYDRMLVMTRWTIGVIALFGTAVTILLAVAQFAP